VTGGKARHYTAAGLPFGSSRNSVMNSKGPTRKPGQSDGYAQRPGAQPKEMDTFGIRQRASACEADVCLCTMCSSEVAILFQSLGPPPLGNATACNSKESGKM
jgi:hypothetical protein